MEPIAGRAIRVTKLDQKGRPLPGTEQVIQGASSVGGMSVSRHQMAAGFRRMWHSGRPAPEARPTHPIEEMIEEAAKRHAQQLARVAEQGCMDCGEPKVDVIEYPPTWHAQMVDQGRYPGEWSKTAIEVTTLVRMVCLTCYAKSKHWEGR